MATLIVYPVAGANSPVDGYAGRGVVNENFATIRAGAGNDSSATNATNSLYFQASATTDQFEYMYRSFTTFDTSALTTAAIISSVVLSLYGESKTLGLGSPAIHIAAAALASTAAVANADYQNKSTTTFGSVAYASWSTSAYNDITLNASGIANINKNGITQFSQQLSWDINNSLTGEGYAWSSGAATNIKSYSADETGTTKDPKLTVTYTPATDAEELADTILFSDPNLTHYYRLEDVNDSIGSENLTNTGTTPFFAARFNNGAYFGASNTTKYLNTTNTLGINGGDCSIGGWVKLQTEIGAGTYSFIHQLNGASQAGYGIQYEYNGGTRRLRMGRFQGGADTAIYINNTLGVVGWHHLAVTYDGTTAIAYLDGVEIGSNTTSGNGPGAVTAGFTIGADNDGNSKSSAIMDDVFVFNRALTADEIDLLYNGPAAATGLGWGYANTGYW